MRVRAFGAARSLGQGPLLASAPNIVPDIFHAMSFPHVRHSLFGPVNRQQFQRLAHTAAVGSPTQQVKFVSRYQKIAARFAATDAE